MANRLLTSMLAVIAVLAIGWTTLVLLWEPPPPKAGAPGNIPPADTPQSAALDEAQPKPPLDADAAVQMESVQTEIGSPPVLDASLGGIDELYRLVSSMGLDVEDFKSRLQEFYCGAGWPPDDDQYSLAGCNLEQPYDQYDMATLQQLAEGGDMWAQQFLADRLTRSRPAEAIEWYQHAAAQGSASAADSIAAIYDLARSDFLSQADEVDPVLLEQTLALRDSSESPRSLAAAWAGVSNMIAHKSGAPLGNYGPSLNQTQFDRACGLAEQLYDQLDQEARDAGRELSPRRVAPLLLADQHGGDNHCPGDRWSDPDTQDCHPFLISFDNIPIASGMSDLQGWICPN